MQTLEHLNKFSREACMDGEAWMVKPTLIFSSDYSEFSPGSIFDCLATVERRSERSHHVYGSERWKT